MSSIAQWTIGPVFYSAVFLAEALGKTNTAQVVDLGANNQNIFTPGYAIYENGALSKLAFVNFVTDPTGASTINVAVGITGGSVPSSVAVK